MAAAAPIVAAAIVNGAANVVGNHYEYRSACERNVREVQAAAVAAGAQLAAAHGGTVNLTVTVAGSETHADVPLVAAAGVVGAVAGAVLAKSLAVAAAKTAGLFCTVMASCTPAGWAVLGALALGCVVAGAVYWWTRKSRSVTVTVASRPQGHVVDHAGRAAAC